MPRTYEKFKPLDTSFGDVSITVTTNNVSVNKSVNDILALIATAFDTYKAVDIDTIGQATSVQF